jgi:hypothetical protein
MTTWKTIFAVVTITALSGMVMGRLFGLAAGRLAPDFFRHLMDVEPAGFAMRRGHSVTGARPGNSTPDCDISRYRPVMNCVDGV